MTVYHGTTEENLRSIRASGLRKGSFVSPDMSVAAYFAYTQSIWNRHEPVILVFSAKTSKIGYDRSGRSEATITEQGSKKFAVVPIGGRAHGSNL